jgi:hypothetical protein
MYKTIINELTKDVIAIMRINANGTCTSFLLDPANTDYAAYLEWVEAGNTPDPAPIPEPPEPLTPAEKLAASGLTVEELRTLLGL